MRCLVLGSRNPGKVREIAAVLGDLGLQVVGLDDWPGLPEPEETGDTFAENARDKALYYARALAAAGLADPWCLADDSGLAVDALDGQPGVHSARYAANEAGPDATRHDIDQANNRKLLAELADVPEERRSARFVCQLALATPEAVLLEARGTIEGRIGYEAAGDNGFGYDPLFEVPELGCTTAELPEDAKNRVSHRGRALQELARRLPEVLTG